LTASGAVDVEARAAAWRAELAALRETIRTHVVADGRWVDESLRGLQRELRGAMSRLSGTQAQTAVAARALHALLERAAAAGDVTSAFAWVTTADLFLARARTLYTGDADDDDPGAAGGGAEAEGAGGSAPDYTATFALARVALFLAGHYPAFARVFLASLLEQCPALVPREPKDASVRVSRRLAAPAPCPPPPPPHLPRRRSSTPSGLRA
jgi:hypothetical protein